MTAKLETKLIIPMHYDTKSLAAFIKEEGGQSVKPIDKLTVKKRDISGLEGQIVVLKS